MDRRPLGSGLERAAAIALGLYLLGTGVDNLGHGRWLYTDYLGLAMPAPLAVVAGLLLLVGFRWRDRSPRRHRRSGPSVWP